MTIHPPGSRRIPEATIKRLPTYLRALQQSFQDRMTSVELGKETGFSSEQIRKDLAYFGAFGTRGVGYDVGELATQIRRILGLDQPINAVVVGAGHLGTALVRFTQSSNHDVRIVAMLDVDLQVIGKVVAGAEVFPLEQMESVVRDFQVRIGVVAVPMSAARDVGDRLCQSGVRAILNFAPVKICANHPEVVVHNIDLTTELQALSYFVAVEETTRAPTEV